MRVVRNDNKKAIVFTETQRKIAIQFIAAHNEKIEKKERLLDIDAPRLKAAR